MCDLALPTDVILKELDRMFDRSYDGMTSLTLGYFWRGLQEAECNYLKRAPALGQSSGLEPIDLSGYGS